MRRTKKQEKPMNLLEIITEIQSQKNLFVKYYNYFTGKTNVQITRNDVVRDLVDFDKRFNNGKGVKRVNKKVSKLLNRIINHFIP